jgi:hypothetical protein
MRWIVLNKLDPEDLKSDPKFDWALDPTFYHDEREDRDFWAVSILHRHWGTRRFEKQSASPPDMFRCGLINREDALKDRAFPEYECDKCGKKVPKEMVEEKIGRQRSLRGVDPRNNRRGAVLATRESNLILDTKES